MDPTALLQAAKAASLPDADVARLDAWLRDRKASADPLVVQQETWRFVSRHVLTPAHPLAQHQALLAACYARWPRQELGPHPVWLPDEGVIREHNVTRFLQRFKGDAAFEAVRGRGSSSQTWQAFHALSVRDPERVLSAVLLQELAVPMHTPPFRILRLSARPDDCQWLPGARLNVAWAALHAPRGGHDVTDRRPAVAWAEEGRPEDVRTMDRVQLRALALQVAACLREMGLRVGDAVAVVLPLTPVSTAVYLGIVLAGCSVVSIADSFAAHEVEARLRIAHAKLVFTQDHMLRGGKPLPLLPRVTGAPNAPPAVVIPGSTPQADLIKSPWTGPPTSAPVQLRPGRDLPWASFIALRPAAAAEAAALLPPSAGVPFVHVASPQEVTNVLFSSGTTGEPKAIVWDHVAPLRPAVDGWAHQAIQAGDHVAWPTSLGWMMGPYLIYCSLFNGACVTLYNGAPLGRDFGHFVRAAQVNVLGLVPSIVKAWRHSGCMEGIDWPSLRILSSTGEASSPEDYHWLMALTSYRAPVIEYCGGTELSGAYATGTSLQPASPSTFSTPSLGTQIVLMVPAAAGAGKHGVVLARSADGEVALSAQEPGAPALTGEVALVAPSLGGSQRLLNKDHHKVYYEGMPVWPGNGRPLRRHGDELCRLPGGYLTALGRVDDTMNLGGIKTASVELERAVMEGVAVVAEAAAVGVPRVGGGPEQLVLFVVLRPGGAAPSAHDLLKSCQSAIREQLNPLFKVERVQVMASLPRNASNKIMRRTLRDDLVRQQQQQQAAPARSKL